MKRVLLTGMSGAGKSTVINELAARGYKAVDADTDEWSGWVYVGAETDPFDPPAPPDSIWRDHDWVWREDRIRRLLSIEDADILFVSGISPNQGIFYPQFDHIILLSAPKEVLIERLANRTTNSYGKNREELARILEHVHTVEPLLRRRASLEVNTSIPLDQVIAMILGHVLP